MEGWSKIFVLLIFLILLTTGYAAGFDGNPAAQPSENSTSIDSGSIEGAETGDMEQFTMDSFLMENGKPYIIMFRRV